MTGMVCCFKSKDFSGVVLFFAICLSVATPSAQKVHGFINIDCGSSVSRYNDSQTSLTWEDDGNYALTGLKGVVPSPVSSSLDNYQALQSFRYFPERRSKYCYELPLTTNNISFLIRGMFLHGNSSALVLPIKFGVYVNATLWTAVEYGLEDNLMTPQMWEAIFYSPGNSASVCLVPIEGAPFISSLELRQFDPQGIVYAFKNREFLFFTNVIRFNMGVSADARTVRYPDDSYDRLWTNPGEMNEYYSINASLPTNVSTGPQVNNVPLKVMMDALTGGPENDGFGGQFNLTLTGTDGYFYALFYFEALNASALDNSGNLVMEVDLGVESRLFNVTTRPSVENYYQIVQTDPVQFGMSSDPVGGNALFNALELYQENSFDSTTTFADDVIFMSNLKSIFNMTDWQGDPCTPVPYDWITCGTVYGINATGQGLVNVQVVESITLSHLQNTGRLIARDDGLGNLLSLYVPKV